MYETSACASELTKYVLYNILLSYVNCKSPKKATGNGKLYTALLDVSEALNETLTCPAIDLTILVRQRGESK